ncbi:MAG: protein-methionine-sulfoxide reductase heme-binding subunit MsrQ [Rhodobacteraceae bacterium]|nr:protein-methionine-sulfoxide reductase heme-binding subunit MsrQ [Paracoccaceae bacterium]
MTDTLNIQIRRIPVWAIYLVLALPGLWLFLQAFTNRLGVDPVKALEHELGRVALQLLIVGLAITPARRHLNLNLLKFRRAVGLVAFAYIALHLLVWLVLDVQILSQVWADIVKRPYITIGLLAFLMALPLALTSNGLSIRKLGKRWGKLHKLVYGVCLLGGLHFIMLAKGFQIEPLIYMTVVISLLALRLVPKPAHRAKAGASA